MNNWPKEFPASNLNTFYGNPDKNNDGRADRDWELKNLVRIIPPYQLYYPSADGKNPRATKFAHLWIHRLCHDSLMASLIGIQKEFSNSEITLFQLDVCGGAYNFRLKRGGAGLSMHSWGCAIDLSHLFNPMGRKYTSDPVRKMMPMRAVKIFADEGWQWGGKWKNPDGMHFQAAR